MPFREIKFNSDNLDELIRKVREDMEEMFEGNVKFSVVGVKFFLVDDELDNFVSWAFFSEPFEESLWSNCKNETEKGDEE